MMHFENNNQKNKHKTIGIYNTRQTDITSRSLLNDTYKHANNNQARSPIHNITQLHTILDYKLPK
jgi:hypothetical protein